ncbi:MAG: exodeoxyribonuclease VII large subunit [Acidimicrobiales bacterium]
MAGTRVQRARDATKPDVEELRFDFSREDDAPAPGDSSLSVDGVAFRSEEPDDIYGLAPVLSVVASEPVPSFSALATEPVLAPGSASDAALSVSDFYERVRGALREAFPNEIWVTGEICKVTTSRGHHYLELADHEGPVVGHADGLGAVRNPASGRNARATLEVACWARDWPVVQYELEAVGVELVPGLVVRVRGKVSVWEGGSKVRFSMTALDVEALVGGIAAARRKLLGALAAEDLLEANRRLALSPVPLRVGLVTSPGSEAYRDFTGQLARSGYMFDVRFEPSSVQGPDAPAQIVAALTRLSVFEPELVVVVRGGGAKGDLAAFDSEAVARAIAEARFPVWTGIGHTGDRSVADEVAHQALVTPTQCGEALVAVVATYLENTDRRARRLAQRVEAHLDQASRKLDSSAASITRAVTRGLERAALELRAGEARIGNAALVTIERSQGRLINRAQRLAGPSAQHLAVQAQQVAHRRELLGLLDPKRQLERGWSLTRDASGKVVRTSASLHRGERLTTTFAKGSAVSVVEELHEPGQSEPEESFRAQKDEGAS